MSKLYSFLFFLAIIFFEPSTSDAFVTDIDGDLTMGQSITVYGANFSSANSKFILGNSNDLSEATVTATFTSTEILWNGPSKITVDTTGFADKELAYLFHYNAGDVSPVGFPFKVGTPKIIRRQPNDSGGITIEGTGFTDNASGAKVYIGDNLTYSDCIVSVEQTSITSWSHKSITFTPSYGTLSLGSTAYIFVIDQRGADSYGYAFTVGLPQVTSYSNGVITGLSFGTDATPEKFDNGETGTYGASLSTNGWSVDGATEPKYDNQNNRPLSTLNILCDNYGNGSNFGILNNSGFKKIYVSYWFLAYHNPTTAESRNIKPFGLRNTGTDSEGYGLPKIRFDVSSTIDETNAYPEDNAATSRIATDKRALSQYPLLQGDETFIDTSWHRREFYIDATNIQAFDNQYRYFRDSVERSYIRGCFMSDHDGGVYKWAKINMFYAQDVGTPIPQAYFWYDDVYISYTQARVEIGNAPIFSQCTHREIQIPTAWSDTSITVTFNQGSFNAGDQVYLFVIDSDGNASDGFPITIGGTSINTTGSLQMTGSLTIE